MAGSIELISTKINPLLGRKEISFKLIHENEATPTKKDVTELLSSTYSIPPGQIYVYGMKTRFGVTITRANANIYSSLEEMKKIERPFVISRITGERPVKTIRRQRKDIRKKAYKMFGTLKRNMKKAEKKSKE